MVRATLLAVLLLTLPCVSASAQGHAQRRVSRVYGIDTGIGGFGNGYSRYGYINPYAYDAYRTGRFRAPDLLRDDFYLDEQIRAQVGARYPHQRDSRCRKPLMLRPTGPVYYRAR